MTFDNYTAYITRFWKTFIVEDINEWKKCSTFSCSGFRKISQYLQTFSSTGNQIQLHYDSVNSSNNRFRILP